MLYSRVHGGGAAASHGLELELDEFFEQSDIDGDGRYRIVPQSEMIRAI